MALEAFVYPQNPYFTTYSANKDLYSMLGGNWVSYDDDEFVTLEKENNIHNNIHDHQDHHNQAADANSSLDFLGSQTESTTCPYGDWNPSPSSMVPHFNDLHLSNNPSPDASSEFQPFDALTTMPTTMTRPKRRRSRSRKNKEDIENQRMTHIAVERNRRKQMNEYLSVLRSLMPDSYVQRGDQASIIGGAINFVKELEQQVQFLGARKEFNNQNSDQVDTPFSEFFTFPQYSTSSTQCDNSVVAMAGDSPAAVAGERRSGIADIEVTMVESHANLKIRSKKRSKQLVKLVSGLHTLRLTVLHLNVTTQDQIVLYSISVKVEDDCKLGSVDEIATAVYQILARIHEETLMAN